MCAVCLQTSKHLKQASHFTQSFQYSPLRMIASLQQGGHQKLKKKKKKHHGEAKLHLRSQN